MRKKKYLLVFIVGGALLLSLVRGVSATKGLPALTAKQQALLGQYNGFYPSLCRLFPYMDETQRIKLHLSLIEKKLRSKDVSRLPAEARRNRKKALDILHDYWVKGQFPRNLRFPGERTPEFIGDNGVVCAVGYLVEKTAGHGVVKKISDRENQSYVMRMRSPELEPWLAQYGLAKEEAAMIQPGYCFGSATPTAFSPPLANTQPTPCVEATVTAASHIALDGLDNLVVAENINTCTACSTAIRVSKYNAAGSPQWAITFTSGGTDWANSIAADAGGNIYVAGGSNTLTAYVAPSIGDPVPGTYRVLKYGPGGSFQWTASYPATASASISMFSKSEQAYGVTADSNGKVYVVGYKADFDLTVSPGPSYLFSSHILQYDAGGTLLHDQNDAWSGSPLTKIAVDGNGNICVGGTFNNTSNCSSDYQALKYNSLWAPSWQKYYGYQYAYGALSGMALDPAGNLFMTGSLGSVMVDAAGNQQWIADNLLGNGIACDGKGNVYVAGNDPSAVSYRVAQYNASTGANGWFLDYPHYGAGSAQEIVAGKNDGIWVSGSARPGAVKFSFAACGPRYTGGNPPGPGDCFAYPAPAKGDHANISYYMAEPGKVEIKVWNEKIEIVDRVTDRKPAGVQVTPLTISGFASGVYFYSVNFEYDSGKKEKTKTHKFVVAH